MRNLAKEIPDPVLWKRFEEAARKQRRDPVRLLRDFMKERLEVWEDQKLDRQVKKAIRSGHHEQDAVEIVRRHRMSKSGPRANS